MFNMIQRRYAREQSMPSAYRRLAELRAQSAPDGFMQPESFGYDFRDWISPYTKGAGKPGGIAIVLQEWASERGLVGQYNPYIAELGRDLKLITNRRLESLLSDVLGTSLSDVYATTVFPFVKPGDMTAPIPQRLVNQTAQMFTAPELEIAKVTKVLALGRVPSHALFAAGVPCIRLPHPAARGMSLDAHAQSWREALAAS